MLGIKVKKQFPEMAAERKFKEENKRRIISLQQRKKIVSTCYKHSVSLDASANLGPLDLNEWLPPGSPRSLNNFHNGIVLMGRQPTEKPNFLYLNNLIFLLNF